MLDGKDARPFLVIHDRLHLGIIGFGLRRICGIDECKEIGVIIRGIVDRALAPVPAIAREFLRAARGGEVLQGGVHVEQFVVPAVVELEPILDFVQVTVVIVGEPFVNDLGAGLLGILIEQAALLAIDEQVHEAAVECRNAELLEHPERRLLALRCAVVVQIAKAGHEKVGCAEHGIVVRKDEDVVADVVERAVVSRRVPGAAAVKRADVVNHATVAID